MNFGKKWSLSRRLQWMMILAGGIGGIFYFMMMVGFIHDLQHRWGWGIGCVLMGMGWGVVMFYGVKMIMNNSFQKVTNHLDQYFEGKQAASPIEIESNDLFGKMVQTVNQLLIRMEPTKKSMEAEIGKMMIAVEHFEDSFSSFQTQLGQTTQNIQQVAHGLSGQSKNLMTLVRLSNEVSSSSNQVGDAVQAAEKIYNQIVSAAEEGGTASQNALERIEKISNVASETTMKISALGSRLSEIDSILHTINEISQQTSLLSLNAAIESARAGKYGRGFAVIADEIRELNESTTLSLQHIDTQVQEIETITTATIRQSQQELDEITTGYTVITSATNLLQQISYEIAGLAQSLQEITTLVTQQRNDLEKMMTLIQDVSQTADENFNMIFEIAAATQQQTHAANSLQAHTTSLNQSATDLQHLIETCQLNSQSEDASHQMDTKNA